MAAPWRVSASTRIIAGLVGALLAVLVVTSALFVWQANKALTARALDLLSLEVDALSQIARAQGLAGLQQAVEQRGAIAGSFHYLLEDDRGRRLAGTLAMPADGLQAEGGVFRYRDATGQDRLAVGMPVVTVGGRLLVARDIEDQLSLARSLRATALAGFAILALCGLAAGLLVSRAVLARVGAIRSASQRILAGDLTERLPETGRGDELDELTRSLNRMIAQIAGLQDGIREVSENIAHDLKTPLNRLRNRAEAALADPRGAAAHREGLERTIEAADEIIQTFNALLLIAKLEAGALERARDPIDIAEVVRDVCELYEPVAEEAGLTLECRIADDCPRVWGNRQLVGQAVANVVDNAIKYSAHAAGLAAAEAAAESLETVGAPLRPAGVGEGASARRSLQTVAARGFVRVSARGERGGAVIRVDDNGPGIAAEDRERVLDRFVRLEKSRSAPGTGLGLSLVAAVARLHGGRLELADNAPGLSLRLHLPRKAASPGG